VTGSGRGSGTGGTLAALGTGVLRDAHAAAAAVRTVRLLHCAVSRPWVVLHMGVCM